MRIDRTLLLVLGFIALVAIVFLVSDRDGATTRGAAAAPAAPAPTEARAKGAHQPKGAEWALEGMP